MLLQPIKKASSTCLKQHTEPINEPRVSSPTSRDATESTRFIRCGRPALAAKLCNRPHHGKQQQPALMVTPCRPFPCACRRPECRRVFACREMQACLGEWRPQYLQGPLVPSSFKKQAVLHPRKPCLVAEDGSVLFYAQTDAAATALARRLAAQGVGLDTAVGILLDRSPSVIVSMLAVHKVRALISSGVGPVHAVPEASYTNTCSSPGVRPATPAPLAAFPAFIPRARRLAAVMYPSTPTSLLTGCPSTWRTHRQWHSSQSTSTWAWRLTWSPTCPANQRWVSQPASKQLVCFFLKRTTAVRLSKDASAKPARGCPAAWHHCAPPRQRLSH